MATVPAITQTFHSLSQRMPWVHPTTGKTYKARSYVYGRANIFAVTSAVQSTGWGIRRWITLSLHSSLTWKSTLPAFVTPSTKLYLNRADAEVLLTALLTAISEFDRQEKEERSAAT